MDKLMICEMLDHETKRSPIDYMPEMEFVEHWHRKTTFDWMVGLWGNYEPSTLSYLDWFVEIRNDYDYSISFKTLCLSINYFDRYLALNHQIRPGDLQIIACACMILASKFEDADEMVIEWFISATEDSHDIKSIFKMETHILNCLNFDMHVTVASDFLPIWCEEIVKIKGLDDFPISNLACYLIVLSMFDYSMSIDYRPSQIATTAVILAVYHFVGEFTWSEELESLSGYNLIDLDACIFRMWDLWSDVAIQNMDDINLIEETFSAEKWNSIYKVIPREACI